MQIAGWPTGNVNAGQAPEPSAMMEPGRVRGWPRGTQVGANAAQRLLSRAVGWWDASFYTPGDRFLRNRGTGSELLDLRLGSSFAPNSNDPLFLAPEDRGYVYLPGVAGNSLSMTAPATATQFIAYPLDQSTATTTGAATGGATFTFSTVGSWRRIELLDASNVVLDTIDCDVITTGSATSFLSVGNQTVTINRSTTGRKAVAMPSRWNGGRPCFLFGTDDYMEVQDTWQHQMLNFRQGDSLTVLAAYRAPSFTANQQVLSKGATGAGYNLRSGAGTPANGIGSAGADPFVLRSAGLSVHAVVCTPDRVTAVVNSVSASTETYPPVNLSNADSFRIGRSSGVVYQDFEFTAAAVFRRALTADDIALITRHYGA